MKKLIALTVVAAATAGVTAAEAPSWLRNVAISPDGKTIAFTYKGDIYTVATEGGTARQLTTDRSYDTAPRWCPDGKRIAFNSDRDGSLDIFVVDATGGTPRRITTNSGAETLLAWCGTDSLLYSASGQPSATARQMPRMPQTYIVAAHPGARPALYSSVPMNRASVRADGALVYEDRKGYENYWRKHEHSSATPDIWLKKGDNFKALTTYNGADREPVWGGGTIYYLNDRDGCLNIYAMAADAPAGTDRQLTTFTDNPVRYLSASADGNMLAFSYDGDVYTLRPGSKPVKVNIDIIGDDYDADRVKGLRTSGAGNMTVTPDGDQVAFVLRGDVYVTDTKYKTTRRITDTPGQERNLSFSPDGRRLVYDSERDGVWQIYMASIVNPDEKSFAYATDVKEEPLVANGITSQQPEFSPDGKKVAYLENRTELKVLDLADRKTVTALDGKYNYSYTDGDVTFAWSPDSRWFLTSYIGTGGWNNTDIALVKADGSEVVDLTESGYSDGNPRWVLGGKGLAYQTSRYGYRSHGSWGEQDDIVLMMLDADAWDDFNLTEEEAALKEKAEKDKKKDSDDSAAKDGKKKSKKDKKDKADKREPEVKPLEFDLANRKYRTRRLTGMSGFMGDYFLSNKGDKLYYTVSSPDGSRNLMVCDLRKGETKVLSKGISGGFMADKKGENLYVSGRSMKKVKLSDGSTEPIEFEAEYDRRPSLEREYIYDHAVRQVRDKFYDKDLHGVDWDKYAATYRKFLPHINNGYDFAELLSELLGELNASHTGGRYSAYNSALPTANLGAFFDESYAGDGLKVSEVIARGPLSSKKAGVQPGDIITAIDGTELKAGTDYYPLLEGKTGRKVALSVRRPDGTERRVTVKPASNGLISSLLYDRWVKRNQALVDSLSNGRLAYVHVQGMDSPSFRTVYDELLGKYRNREAVIVDTRYNGGGWLHNDIAILLGGREYVRFSPRGQYIGSEPFSQWTKPSVMLVNEANYSDAHGTPYVYQTLGLGDIVGAPVPGTMTAVWWETQIDPSIVFGIPQVTSLDVNGKVLENQQLNPDVVIYNNPADVANGRDAQIEGAVHHLLDKLDKQAR